MFADKKIIFVTWIAIAAVIAITWLLSFYLYYEYYPAIGWTRYGTDPVPMCIVMTIIYALLGAVGTIFEWLVIPSEIQTW